jgi:predicted nucleic acid-binding Zn ribbon protein
MPEIKRQCLACGKALLVGRSDKKYCNDICRTAYSNDKKGNENKEIRTIFLALKRNRNILKRLRGEKESILISEQVLVHSGFIFDYHTHYFTSETQKNTFTFCFDYGYRDTGGKRYKIIRRW